MGRVEFEDRTLVVVSKMLDPEPASSSIEVVEQLTLAALLEALSSQTRFRDLDAALTALVAERIADLPIAKKDEVLPPVTALITRGIGGEMPEEETLFHIYEKLVVETHGAARLALGISLGNRAVRCLGGHDKTVARKLGNETAQRYAREMAFLGYGEAKICAHHVTNKDSRFARQHVPTILRRLDDIIAVLRSLPMEMKNSSNELIVRAC